MFSALYLVFEHLLLIGVKMDRLIFKGKVVKVNYGRLNTHIFFHLSRKKMDSVVSETSIELVGDHHTNSLLILFSYIFMPRHKKWRAYYVIPSEILSVRPSVRPSICPSALPSFVAAP